MTCDAICRAGKSIYKLAIGTGMCVGLAQNEVNRFTSKIKALLMRVWNASLGRACKHALYASAYAGGRTTRA